MQYPFNELQRDVVKKLGFDPGQEYDENSSDDLLEAVSDYLMVHGFGEDYKPNQEGTICEDIITILTQE